MTAPPTSPEHADLRFIRALSQRLDSVGSYAALARAIALTQPYNENAPEGEKQRDPIDRRKLARAIEGGDPDSLTLGDLRIIDSYLEVFGEGLAFHPLFEKPALLQSLAESGEVNFLIGSRSEELRQNFSHWDLLGMAEIQRAINGCGANVRFDIREVSEDMNDQRLLHKRVPWRALLQEAGPSLVCLGSCRTIPAAESMARAMFGGTPFGKDSLQKEDLPFHFVWSEKPPYLADSPFHLVSDEIKDLDPAAAKLVANGEGSALKIGDHVVVDQVTPQSGGVAYGICVAQRRMNGQVWLLVAGIAGVATFVGAKLTNQFTINLPEAIDGSPAPVYWSVIRAKVDKPTAKQPFYSVRNFPEESVFDGPNRWVPAGD
jgi:hypothetical protein